MQRDLVEQRHWIDRQDFLDRVALGQTMPGPLAAQVAMWVGYPRHRATGATGVAVAFVAPAFAIVVATPDHHLADLGKGTSCQCAQFGHVTPEDQCRPGKRLVCRLA
jgi:hypothetical protein